jgi:DNA-binding transcriptional LysR family regulator
VVDRDVVLQLGHPEAMKQAAANGVGAAFLFRRAVTADLAARRLREIKVDGVEMVFPIFVVYRKGKSLSPLHLNLIEHIRAALSVGCAQPVLALPTAS